MAQIFSTPSAFRLLAVAVAVNYVIFQFRSIAAISQNLDLPDNDDLMRLLSVRNWLSGQSWFDMTQYTLMPPEGLSLHWSRYVDAGIAGLQWLLALVLSPRAAEGWSATLWPGIVLAVFATVTARGMARTYGLQAASFALLPIITVSVFPFGYFPVGRIDHHNVQMTLMLISTVCLMRERGPLSSGGLSGLFAALSLAIGLESIFFYAVTGLMLAGFAVLDIRRGRHRLLGFGLGLGLAAPLFFAGQTAVERWAEPHCDALFLPVLWVTSVALVFSVAFFALTQRATTPLSRGLLAGVLGAACLALLWPQVMVCADGPYGTLPAEVQRLVLTSISETRPVTARSEDIFTILLPALGSLVAAVFALRSKATTLDKAQRGIGWMLVILLAGMTVGLTVQSRFAVSVYAVMPLVFGFAVSALLGMPPDGPRRMRRVITAGAFASVFLSMPFGLAAIRLAALGKNAPVSATVPEGTEDKAAATKGPIDGPCRSSAVLADLNKIPRARVLASINLGPAIALHTHHLVLAAPYHRNVQAIVNGLHAIRLPEDAFLEALRPTDAELLVVCEGSDYGPDAVANDLAAGEARAWAVPVKVGDGPLRVFRLTVPEAQE